MSSKEPNALSAASGHPAVMTPTTQSTNRNVLIPSATGAVKDATTAREYLIKSSFALVSEELTTEKFAKILQEAVQDNLNVPSTSRQAVRAVAFLLEEATMQTLANSLCSVVMEQFQAVETAAATITTRLEEATKTLMETTETLWQETQEQQAVAAAVAPAPGTTPRDPTTARMQARVEVLTRQILIDIEDKEARTKTLSTSNTDIGD
ncbi:hypothetical protein NEOLEDRAFT_1151759 [Neolentinus lepideus HHB14362 ss-1]|uniref:Uncharacterized protein n=1 Tax=Neolentinus lepideus HHB14362 ss-1 TaxID=1314782 RepID=A0A165NKU5_9AGAM|nr:hypothetical protein NEOLEDRAFT_1151759 [Neolentinus lepideus HHB14362 ss-1]